MVRAVAGGSGGLQALLTLAWPVVLSRLGIMVMGLTDAIVVGRYSADELAYHALGWAPTMVVLTTGVGLLLGVQVRTAQLIGDGRADEAGAVLRRGLIFAALVGCASGAALFFGARPLMLLLQLEPGLAGPSAEAARIFALSTPFYLVATTAALWLEAVKRPVPAMLVMFGANIVNLVLCLWLVPGTSPFGVDGAVAAGWSTFGARLAYMIGLLAFILLWPSGRTFGLFLRARSRHWRELLRIGFASAGSLFVETSGFAGMNVVAGWIGGLTVAGFAILLNVAATVFMVPLGLSAATAVLVGNGFGARDFSVVRRDGWTGIGFTAALMTLVALLVWLADDLIVAAYTTEPALAALVVPAVALAALFFTMDGVQVVTANALRAVDDVWIPTLTHTISYVAIMLPLGWWLALPLGLGLQGLVLAIIIASLLAGGFLLARFGWITRRGASLRARRAE